MADAVDAMDHSRGSDIGSIARQLNRVIEAAQQRDGGVYSNKNIATRSTELGYPVSPAQVSHIRTGRVRNPSFRAMEGIALALGVDVREFLDGEAARQADTESALDRQLAKAGVEAIGFRLSELGRLNALGQSTFKSIVTTILSDLQSQQMYRREDASDDEGGPM